MFQICRPGADRLRCSGTRGDPAACRARRRSSATTPTPSSTSSGTPIATATSGLGPPRSAAADAAGGTATSPVSGPLPVSTRTTAVAGAPPGAGRVSR